MKIRPGLWKALCHYLKKTHKTNKQKQPNTTTPNKRGKQLSKHKDKF